MTTTYANEWPGILQSSPLICSSFISYHFFWILKINNDADIASFQWFNTVHMHIRLKATLFLVEFLTKNKFLFYLHPFQIMILNTRHGKTKIKLLWKILNQPTSCAMVWGFYKLLHLLNQLPFVSLNVSLC